MTTKTTITLSPIKRCNTSPNLQKRRITSILTHRKYQTNLSLTISNMISSPKTTIIVSDEQKNLSINNLPDLVNDILIEQQQRQQTINNIAITLRKISDQIDEKLQINNNNLSSNHIFGQRTMTFIYCLSHILRFFL
ncbi:unnamed protein product [Rotaria sordida]|uniref:Uncharacterized protein n=1 Tax=Rotaria sordida TaxID=392033 RepID=A0A814N987_9BILA|nr:unnamed protein product [Rotaria sordida]CAF3692773.1 unnamed protein product [Rotaria sordida]